MAKKKSKKAVKQRGAKTSLDMEENVEALLCYVLGWVSGLIFLLVEKKSRFVRFHAMQSLVVFLALFVIAMIPIIGWALSPLIAIIGFILWIFLMVKAYNGEKYKLPIVGDFAEKHS